MKDISAFLAQRKHASLHRHRLTLNTPQGAHIAVEGRSYISFCSNDYLGLANDPRLIKALKHGADKFGVSSGSAHLISGHSMAHHQLELALADFVGYERVLLFSTGYMANLGVITALVDRKEALFQDKLNHASLIDAARLAQATLKRYLHGDASSLKQQMATVNDNSTHLVVTDGVFSMDGDLAPLVELSKVCHQNNGLLVVDDAHGLGVIGKQGRGTASHFGLASAPPILIGTFGKAFGTFGAFVAASDEIIEMLIQLARTYIYTTALPPAMAHATLCSLNILKNEEWRRQHLRKLISKFRTHAKQLGLKLGDSTTPIQPVLIGDTQQALAISQKLNAAGILTPAIRPPAVPQGGARLRITFSAQHTCDDVERLLCALEAATQ